jgi:hypothetical protein
MTPLQAWVLREIIASGPVGATQLIARAAGQWYEASHPTHWRRVDRAIQMLRKGGFIEYNGTKWTAK